MAETPQSVGVELGGPSTVRLGVTVQVRLYGEDIMNNLGGMKGLKVRLDPESARRSLAGAAVSGLVAVLIGGCAALPPTEPVAEKLDPDTATTVTVLSTPIELYSQTSRARQTDPFAYIAPFETNRMGARELYLWVSTPQAQGQLTQPTVKCNGQTLELKPVSQDGSGAGVAQEAGKGGDFGGVGADGAAIKIDLAKLSLSRAPYSAPVPWGTQWYFRLSEDGLKCLAGAEGVSLQAKAADGSAEEFTSTGGRKSLASLDAFQRR